jgi:hypothetical protein
MEEEKKEISELKKWSIINSIERNYPNNPIAQNTFRVAEGLPTIDEDEKEKKIDEARILLGKNYEMIKEILSDYIDVDESRKTLIALWIIGTWMHNSFETYPYLFINAMRGSGKTRTLKIISNLAWEGQLLASLTESVLFRSIGTLAIDEFESIGSKEKQALRELINAGYKKGITIRRMKKVKKRNEQGNMEEGQESESFEAYRPIVMANIWGMDEVLGDRCITIHLEKSASDKHTMKIENFSTNSKIQMIKSNFSVVRCSLCSLVYIGGLYTDWNNYIDSIYLGDLSAQIVVPKDNLVVPKDNITTPNYTTTLTTHNYTKLHQKTKQDEFFNAIYKIRLDGRHLELYFPLFIVANFLNKDIFEEILKIASSQVEDKKVDEVMESKDIMLFDFISRKYESVYLDNVETYSWISLNDLTKQFREFIGDEDEKAESWLNSKWMGRALRRLCLILQKRRLGRGMDVVLNKKKAEDKMKIFYR